MAIGITLLVQKRYKSEDTSKKEFPERTLVLLLTDIENTV